MGKLLRLATSSNSPHTRLNLSYYAGLLSAAQYHGAVHQRPQEFQVFVARNRRPIRCGAVRVAFIARKRLADVPVQSFNMPRGTALVSTSRPRPWAFYW
ncbi:MAG: type IV toxin-antitoxin system AbiEi family antitoxin [Candidatus Binataceae bacterium]